MNANADVKCASEQSVVLRSYQRELLEICLERNTIIFLPTGSGKTMIAKEVLRQMGTCLTETPQNGGKRSIFLVPTKALVYQQAAVLTRELPYTVGFYVGDMGVDYWPIQKWSAIIEKNQVLVMTPTILQNLLTRAIVTLEVFNLIIVDECHHAVNDHSYREIMKRMQDIDEEQQPRVIGLSATLLNRTVSSHAGILNELHSLEETFHGRIATSESLAEVLKFSANPNTSVEVFSEHSLPQAASIIDELMISLNLDEIDRIERETSYRAVPHGYSPMAGTKYAPLSKRKLLDCKELCDDLGIYGGAATALYHIIDMATTKMATNSELFSMILSNLETGLYTYRSDLLRFMDDDESPENILKFSSPKLILLLDLLKRCKEEDMTALVFVERRSCAIALNTIFNKFSKMRGLEFLKCGFVVGSRSTAGGYRESTKQNLLHEKWQQQTIKKFANGDLNILFATSIVEEGVDITSCNLVIFFNADKITYRNYIQAKGRARNKKSRFILMSSRAKCAQDKIKLSQYDSIEKLLYDILLSKCDILPEPTEAIEENLYKDDIEPYYVAGPGSAFVTGITAIPCIMKYCARLPQDLFSSLGPLCFQKRVGDEVQVYIQLPIQSKVKQTIKGQPKETRKLAKRSAFVEAVRLLHAAGELDDDLQPRDVAADQQFEQSYTWVVPLYKIGGIYKRDGLKATTHVYDTKSPLCLSDCLPTTECYLHVFKYVANYDEPTQNRKRVLKGLIDCDNTYAFLSTKRLPKICSFPLYMSSGEITCHVVSLFTPVELTDEQFKAIGKFHWELFNELVPCTKNFQSMTREKKDCSFYIVPVRLDNDHGYAIEWPVINNFQSLIKPVAEDRNNFTASVASHNLSVISPFYRGNAKPDYYIATKVLTELNPLSSFPDNGRNEVKTYAEYFKVKYSETVLNLEQPLIEVQTLPKLTSNFIRPRVSNSSVAIKSRRKMQEEEGDFNEILVPELCHRYLYPAVLWLKAFMLPSTLHRLTSILLVEELRQKVADGIGLRKFPYSDWESFAPEHNQQPRDTLNITEDISKLIIKRPRALREMHQTPAATLWEDGKEPKDIFLQMDKVAECDIKLFVEFTRDTKAINNISTGQSFPEEPSNKFASVQQCEPMALSILNVNNNDGPQLRTLIAAFTTKGVNDFVNLERLETLGDSFLKFSSALFLFREFPDENEGFLDGLKGRIVSNRHLLYCGQDKDLPYVLQFQEFSADCAWCPPLIGVCDDIADYISSFNKDGRVLYDLNIPKVEQISGRLSPKSLTKIRQIIEKSDDVREGADQTFIRTFFGKRTIGDKNVADCVEALIGAYLQTAGMVAGLKLLNWLQILPDIKHPAPYYIETKSKSACLNPGQKSKVIIELQKIHYQTLENSLNYKFKDPSFLLQALTHPTFTYHRTTDCYQRLEFLGDAVLDFLITSYIFEVAPWMNPGEITQLRSALVNNTTFACYVVKYGFHRYLLSNCQPLNEAIAFFANYQERRNHVADEAVFILYDEGDTRIAEAVEVPKALGDLFESIAGAIFLDSGNSLKEVWRVFYPIMKNELDKFTAQIPRTSVSLLHEILSQRPPVYEYEVVKNYTRARLEVSFPGLEPFVCHGFGKNKSEAKVCAAKHALRTYYNLK